MLQYNKNDRRWLAIPKKMTFKQPSSTSSAAQLRDTRPASRPVTRPQGEYP